MYIYENRSRISYIGQLCFNNFSNDVLMRVPSRMEKLKYIKLNVRNESHANRIRNFYPRVYYIESLHDQLPTKFFLTKTACKRVLKK